MSNSHFAEPTRDVNKNKTDEQQARSEARLEFLQLMQLLKGRSVQAKTAEGNSVECEFEEVDRPCTQLAVTHLVTPMGTLDRAILRVNDFDSFRFPARK